MYTDTVDSSQRLLPRPFLVRLSTDKWDSLLCARNIVLQTPHRFEAARRSSMADFRRASLEFDQLAKVTTSDAVNSADCVWCSRVIRLTDVTCTLCVADHDGFWAGGGGR